MNTSEMSYKDFKKWREEEIKKQEEIKSALFQKELLEDQNLNKINNELIKEIGDILKSESYKIRREKFNRNFSYPRYIKDYPNECIEIRFFINLETRSFVSLFFPFFDFNKVFSLEDLLNDLNPFDEEVGGMINMFRDYEEGSEIIKNVVRKLILKRELAKELPIINKKEKVNKV